jgi:alpha-ribazole phosphatase
MHHVNQSIVKETFIDFMRHGEPEGGRRYRGNAVDDPLSEKGWQQMWDAVGDRPPWQRIISSPMRRCSAFAEAVAHRCGLEFSTDDRLREVAFGSWEGFSPDEIISRNRAEYEAFSRDPGRNRPAGAEALEDFGQRVAEALEDILSDCRGDHVLVVAHAGVVRAVLGYILNTDPIAWYRARIDNAAFTRLRKDQYGNRLEFHNRRRLEG